MDSNVKVAVRCRPMSSKESARESKCVIAIAGNTVRVQRPDDQRDVREFTFDHCYFTDSTQEQVYADLGQPLLSQALDGFNGTIFAYGQTGSGKSFSMMGTESSKGIIPKLNDNLWQSLAILSQTNASKKYMITVSFLEIYNEVVKDLLNPKDTELKIRESPKLGIYVEGLCELIVRDPNDFLRLIEQGNAVRRVAATNMNEQSSRSHSCFTVKIEQKTVTELEGGVTREQLVKAKLNLVDLAGSERAEKTGATGATLKEGANINMSLMALGNVINALSEGGSKPKHIPYRDSKLTRLLQESLGGNALTVMLAAISPADYNFDETLSTLKYANRAKSIANAVTRNEDSNERLIRGLKEEIELLKQQLTSSGGGEANPEMLSKLQEMEQNQQSAWEEKEALQKALEKERQENMNTVISHMMDAVKEQKVKHMKTIKRLNNEKTVMTKKFKDVRDENAVLKTKLDSGMKRYQQCQLEYDAIFAKGNDITPLEQQKLEKIASEMSSILAGIETDRSAWLVTKDSAKAIKARLLAIDEELTDQKAELVTTAGMLEQNQKLRMQIQEEEREKAREMIAQEMAAAREKLDVELAAVRGTVEGELAEEMASLRRHISDLQGELKVEKIETSRLALENGKLQSTIEELENKLADAEVNQEYADIEVERLTVETNGLDDLKYTIDCLNAEIMQLKEEHKIDKEALSFVRVEKDKSAELALEAVKARAHAEKYEVFKVLMDSFNEERAAMDKKLADTQTMLSNAVTDVLFLTNQVEELRVALQQAILWEPTISASQPHSNQHMSNPSYQSSVYVNNTSAPTAGAAVGKPATVPSPTRWGNLISASTAAEAKADHSPSGAASSRDLPVMIAALKKTGSIRSTGMASARSASGVTWAPSVT